MTRARKRFGQHFLEPAWVSKLIRAIDPRPDEIFLEIGPGRGALTRPLAARAQQVIAFEIDRDLAAALRAEALPNVELIEGDFLETANAATLPMEPCRTVGNLPYNVASPILFALVDLFHRGVRLNDAIVMLQREVADRLLASPGTSDYGVLTVLIGHSASVDRLLDLPPGAFRPAPKVRSSVVRLRFHARDPAVRDADIFEGLVQAVFTRRRKTIANALRAFPPASGTPLPGWLDGTRRPETLTIAEFARLADTYVRPAEADQ
jgi:16S rRNA (adenine1518-N6/adenine1519-N6)-dimethyltransferase